MTFANSRSLRRAALLASRAFFAVAAPAFAQGMPRIRLGLTSPKPSWARAAFCTTLNWLSACWLGAIASAEQDRRGQ